MQITRVGGPDDAPLMQAQLSDGDVRLSLLNLGAITQGWWVPCGGASVPVVLGYAAPGAYLMDDAYLGAIVGRVANRTSGGRLVIDNEMFQLSQNEGQTHLHGGQRGLSGRLWDIDGDSAGNAVRFSYHSPDGEEGYPGSVDFTVTVTLKGARVTYDMTATADRPTPVNLAQHNYYNLMGGGEIWGHQLTCIADRRTPVKSCRLTPAAMISAISPRLARWIRAARAAISIWFSPTPATPPRRLRKWWPPMGCICGCGLISPARSFIPPRI